MFNRSLAALVLLVFGAGLFLPEVSDARPRRGRYGYRGGYGHRYGGWGYGYPSFHLAYAPGFYPSVGVGFGHYPFSLGLSFAGGPKDPRGQLRFDVHPKQAEVYIDGYYAGIVDDFGKLRLDPGPHDVSLYLDGYRIFEETVYSSNGSTVRIHHEMEPLAVGEVAPARPAVPTSRARAATSSRAAPVLTPAPPPPTTPGPSLSSSAAVSTGSFGVLALRTQPVGAQIFIDGEQWHVPAGNERLELHLPAGTYELELRKEGFEPFLTAVDVQVRKTTALNVLLGTPR